MGKKDKKKGKGAEKTAAKTEKKAFQKAKKELAAKGEDDIEMLIAEFQARDEQQSYVGEEKCTPPSPRSCLVLSAHPEKDELLLFGGEYFNGAKTSMYNDLFFYNIKKDQWTILQCSNKPPPRCSHQAVAVSQGGGQLWIFGGEFASPTRSNFYHYKDLWVYHMAEKRWEQVKAAGGPSARSGHRMVFSRKKLIVFGGFQESIRDHKYFNDVHIFDLETYKWSKVEPSGKGPSPRSGCQMVALSDGRVLIYGGYSKEKIKKDVEKGIAHTDMYYLQLDDRAGVCKWKWVQVRQSGIQPSARSGLSIALASGNRAFLFGGVQDQEDTEETLNSLFYNDFYVLELEKGRWLPVTLHSKTEGEERKRRRKVRETEEDAEADCAIEDLSITDEPKVEVKTSEDSVFTLRIETSSATQAEGGEPSSVVQNVDKSQPFQPHPRMNACLVVKHGTLYLYGGLYEDGDKQLTLCDFYSCDLHKMNEWQTIIPSNLEDMEWFDSSESSSGSDDDEEECSDDEEQQDSNDNDMDTT